MVLFLCKKVRKEGIPMAGRKPKPTAVKKLEGNPGKRKLNTKEPVPAKKPRNTSIPRALHLKQIRVTNSRLHGLVSQILIRS